MEGNMTIQAEQRFPGPFAAVGRRETIHDLRNLFTIVAAAKSLLDQATERVSRSELLTAIGDACIRGGKLTTSLLAEAVPSHVSTATDVGARLADLAPMMNVLAEPKLELDLEVGRASAFIDPADFDAAIIELVANARKAEAHTIVLRSRQVGSCLWILVSDDGRGMAAAALARAQLGHDAGTAHGAGLAGVHRFARGSHGKVLIRSRAFAGTSVALVLPTVSSPQPASAPHRRVIPNAKETCHDQNRQSAPA
jgi:signal transduction histidine kinase